MASVAMPLQPAGGHRDEQVMDTRTPSPSLRGGTNNSEYKPDLSQEVAMLSTKLINAINYQTTLDDSLQHTRHELEVSRQQHAQVQADKKQIDDMIADGHLVRRSYTDNVISQLRAELAAERTARESAEKARKQTEGELETLTSALFEEANGMVAAARKDVDAAERRNSQLKSQLSDTEVLLASQQEQLQDLKLTMEKMSERGDNDTQAGRDSVPSTPIHPPAGMFDRFQDSPHATSASDFPPEHPLHFPHLLVPVLRSDVTAYNEFQDLLQGARIASAHARSSSGSNLTSSSQPNLVSNSSPSLPGAFSFSASPSPQSSGSAPNGPVIPLKESKFYKRSLVEDIEPTLRLDLAPGLSFLSRRGVLSSLLQGSLVVEPFMPSTKFYGPIYACALCGESRKHEQFVRKHRFRTSEDDSAQRYPLCDYCLGRIRASGDFISFLRMVRDGLWRAETEDERKGAWEEAVRLRERMFWARIGGGVVPAQGQKGDNSPPITAAKSARLSLDSIPERADKAPPALPQPVTDMNDSADGAQRPSLEQKLVQVFQRHRRSMSIGQSLPNIETDIRDQTQESAIVEEQQEPTKTVADNGATGVTKEVTPQPASLPTVEAPQATTEIESKPDQVALEPAVQRPISSAIDDSSNFPVLAPPRQSIDQKRESQDSTVSDSKRRFSDARSSVSPQRERKQSGVLARVRAMEAQAQVKSAAEKKPPGAFE